MNNKLMIAVIMLLPFFAIAQQAEPIPSFARNPQSMSWYHQQQKAWEKEVKAHPKNANAWMNYFYVSRILMNHDDEHKLSNKEKEKVMEDILQQMFIEIPETYEYNFCKWQSKGNDMAYYAYLEKAVAIDPSRTEHIDYMINIGELQDKEKQRDEYSRRKFEAGQLSAGLMYYNYNTMAGLEPNAILITAGDNDTYPAWALQSRGIRKDVKILNLALLNIDSYREHILRDLQATPVIGDTSTRQADFTKLILQSLIGNKKNRPVYFSLTASDCDHYLDEIQDKLYLIGLAYKYDTASYDNMAILRRNFENRYALDYLDKAFYVETSEARLREINTNYLVPMLKLHEHYSMSGEADRAKWIGEKITLIAKDTEHEKDILKALSEQ